MHKDKRWKPSKILTPAPATAPPPWMPKGKPSSHESQLKDLARSRAAKKGH